MDGTEDPSYLTLLNDGTHNYLLQTTEESLDVQDPTLNVEPMFTEIEDGNTAWSVGLPILMNGNLISEADQELSSSINYNSTTQNNEVGSMELSGSLPQLYGESIDSQEETSLQGDVTSEESQITYPIEIPGKGFITADGLFITNDLLLQLKLNLDNDVGDNQNLNLDTEDDKIKNNLPLISKGSEVLVNSKAHNSIPTEQIPVAKVAKQNSSLNPNALFEDASELQLTNGCLQNEQIFNIDSVNQGNEVIQLLNSDGTVININKSLLNYNDSKTQPVSPKVIEEQIEEPADNNSDIYDIIMAFKCKKCSFICEDRQDITKHWQNQHLKIQEAKENNSLLKTKFHMNGEIRMKSLLKNSDHQTVYVCSECNLGYSSTEKLRNHMIIAHRLVQRPADLVLNEEKKPEENTNKVPSITSGTKQKLTLADVQKQAKATKKIKCSIKGCDLRFAVDEMRIRHEKCHVEGQKKQFKCFECSTKFSLWRVCSMHMWKCHKVDLGLFTCPMCSVFKASTPIRLFTHMAIHEEEKPFLCNNCGKSFKQHSQLKNHQVIHKESGRVPGWSLQQQCDTCKKFFANSKSLKKHVQSVHNKFKPFICNICGHQTARKAMLELHLRQHTGEKPHKCPICDYKTGDHNSLRRHVMRHSGDTKYACPHCNYQSIQSTSYKNHIASKHPGLGGSYFCTLCSYHTVNENTYNSHLADHKNGLIKENVDNNKKIEDRNKKLISKEDNSLLNGNLQTQNGCKEDDDETQNYLLMLDHSNDAVDTGGITIPAGFELQVPL